MAVCPLAVDWSNVADWAAVAVAASAAVANWVAVAVAAAAAGATLWAVVVAMRSSTAAIEEARRLRAEDRAAKFEAEKAAAVARSIVLDHELYMLGGEVRDIADHLSQPGALTKPHHARAWAAKQFPSDPLPLLTRFAGDLDAFGTTGAADLLSALSSWQVHRSMLADHRFEDSDDQEAREDMEALVRSLRTFQRVIAVARNLTYHWATDGKGGLPETDF